MDIYDCLFAIGQDFYLYVCKNKCYESLFYQVKASGLNTFHSSLSLEKCKMPLHLGKEI